MCVRECECVGVCECVWLSGCACVLVCMCVYVCVSVCVGVCGVCVSVWVCVCVSSNVLEVFAVSFFRVIRLQMTVHRDKFFIIKPSRCINFSNLFLEEISTCFGQFPCPSSRVFHCTHSNTYRFGDSLMSATLYDIFHCRVYSGTHCGIPQYIEI